jgi:hypothetical protein
METNLLPVLLPDAALHWRAGWGLILLGFASGALLGLGFHRPDFAGGYASLRRRLLRLGHVALVALGALNLLAAGAPAGASSPTGGALLLAGSLAMPAVTFLTAWRSSFRAAFALPVLALLGAAGCFLAGGAA